MIILETIAKMVFSPEGFIATAFALGAVHGIYKAVKDDD